MHGSIKVSFWVLLTNNLWGEQNFDILDMHKERMHMHYINMYMQVKKTCICRSMYNTLAAVIGRRTLANLSGFGLGAVDCTVQLFYDLTV
jgi:hypothetical protein